MKEKRREKDLKKEKEGEDGKGNKGKIWNIKRQIKEGK